MMGPPPNRPLRPILGLSLGTMDRGYFKVKTIEAR